MEERGLDREPFERIGREGLRLDAHHIIELTSATLNAFLEGGPAALTDEEMTVGVLDDPREINDGDLLVAFDGSYVTGEHPASKDLEQRQYGDPASGYTDHKPLQQLDYVRLLFDHAWLGTFDAPSRSLVRIGETALAMELVSQAIRYRSAGTPNAPTFDFLQYDISLDPTYEGLALAGKALFFDGLWWVCSCGDWGDSADFIWVWGGVPIVSMSTQCGGWIDGVDLLPPILSVERVTIRSAEREVLSQQTRRWEKR